jgi:hypothetical protein
MMETDTLFLHTLCDIERRLSDTDPYEILLIAGLIRKLFLDDHPLVDQVNKKHRIKLTFEVPVPVNMPQNEPLPRFWNVQDGLDPDTAPPFKQRHTVTRDQFFQTVVTVVNNHGYSIREIVLFEANVVGAVHAGTPKTDKESALKQIDSVISIGGYASSLRQLKAIARVILKALAPLRQAVSQA